MSNIRFLRTFIAVAHGGSFAAAATKVALTQAAVSMQMQALEADLRQSLFDRSGRIVRLNSTGKIILARAEQLVALYDGMRAIGATHDELVGSVTVGAVVSVMSALAAAVAQLKTLHPKLEIRLIAAKSLELAPQVENGEIDAALIVAGPSKPPTSLVWAPLYTEPQVLIAARANAGMSAVELLQTHPFLRFDRTQRTGVLIERALKKNQLAINEFLELNSLEAIVELVRQDIGVTIVPLLRRASWTTDPALRILALHQATPRRAIGMLERKNHERQRVTAAIRQRIRDDSAQGV